MTTLPRVLIVDNSAESRDVLRTLLELHGATTIEAHHADEAVEIARRCRPDLILLDSESDHSVAGSATDQLRSVAGRSDTPIVILGSVPRAFGALSPGQFMAKPYHYGELLRKIGGLLAAA